MVSGTVPAGGVSCPEFPRAVAWESLRGHRGPNGDSAGLQLCPRWKPWSLPWGMMMGWVIPVLSWGCGSCRFTLSGRPEMACGRDSPLVPKPAAGTGGTGHFGRCFSSPYGWQGSVPSGPGVCCLGGYGVVSYESRRSGVAVTGVAILGKSVQEAQNGGASQERPLHPPVVAFQFPAGRVGFTGSCGRSDDGTCLA